MKKRINRYHSAQKKKSRLFMVLLGSVFLLAFLLRFIGGYPGYPDIHPDEGTSYSTAVYMIYNFLKPDRFDYPAGVPFMHAVIYMLFIVPTRVVHILFTQPESFWKGVDFFVYYHDDIFGRRDILAMFWSRSISAAFGFGAVVFTYFASKKLFNKWVGLIAAFLLAVNYLHVVRSHFGLPDSHNSFFVTLVLFGCALLLEKQTLKRYLFTGICAGIMFALKYQVFGFLPFFMTVAILAWEKKNIFYLINKNFIISVIVALLTFILLNPFYLFNLDVAIRMNKQDVGRYAMGSYIFRPYGYFYLYHWGVGQLVSIAVLCGFVFMALRDTKKWLIISSFALTFFFFMTYYSQGGIFTRNFGNVISYVLIYAAYFFWVLFIFLRRFGQNAAVGAITCIILLASFAPLRDSATLAWYYAKPWNVDATSTWLEKSLPPGVAFRYYQSFLPQPTMQALGMKNTKLLDWDYSKGPNSLAEFREENTDFAMLNISAYQSITYWWKGWLNSKLLFSYDAVPFDFIENDFYGLTIKELGRYTVYEAYKPWQAHHDNNYIVYKIPPKITDVGTEIASFAFDNGHQGWKVRYKDFGAEPIKYGWIADVGVDSTGALVATPGGDVRSRIGSPAIPVRAGKIYTAQGMIKNPLDNDDIRDGFLRLDFYPDTKPETMSKIGLAVAISPRATGSGEWIQEQVSAVAPKDAKFMTVSFQFKDTFFSSIIDAIKIFETTKKPEETFKQVPYIRSTLPIESLYYNTFI